ncbi:MAG: DUF4388 domain-containing protein [Thermoanaerobaculales bacterium]|jgi:hypothetical protein|nr:DUF4388 domain-containing protein [Thermoanaerobaculales bacterium]
MDTAHALGYFRSGMPITGNLETMNLAELLQWLANNRQTGTLIIADGRVEKKIYLRGGTILSSSSSDPKQLLGHFLVSKGVITEEVLSQAMTVQEQQGGLLGEILVEGGALDQATLDRMLKLNAEENICDLFAWEKGSFEFLDGQLPDHELVPMSANITGLIMEGMRRIDHARAMRELIPSPQCVPVAVAALLEADELDLGWRGVLEAVDDDRSIEDICLHTHSSEFFVCQVLYRAMRDGKLKIVRPRAPKAEPAPEATRRAESAATAGALLGAAMQHLEDGDLEAAVRYLRAASSLEPDNRDLRTLIQQKELEIRGHIADAGVDLDLVPVLVAKLDQLRGTRFTPEEGFILSRINGASDIRSIIKISPLSELGSLLVFWKLVRAGHIRFEGAR